MKFRKFLKKFDMKESGGAYFAIPYEKTKVQKNQKNLQKKNIRDAVERAHELNSVRPKKSGHVSRDGIQSQHSHDQSRHEAVRNEIETQRTIPVVLPGLGVGFPGNKSRWDVLIEHAGGE
jgi:hypothetical protein